MENIMCQTIQKSFVALLAAVAVGSLSDHLQADENIRAGKFGAGKPYVISVNVRQSYDDNINTAPAGQRQGSFKTSVSPGISLNFPMDQTTISASYFFGATYFWDRPGDDFDLSHTFTGRINHRFTERFEVDIRESFRYAQEPQVADGAIVQRRLGDGFVNRAGIEGSYVWTDRISTVTGYENTMADYRDQAVGANNDRMEHTVSQDFRIAVIPTTTGVVNYTYRRIDYRTAPRSRDLHFGLVGADHYLLPEWLISGRVGAEYVIFDDARLNDSVGPFVSLNTVWNYLPRNSVRAGYRYGTNITDDPNFADIEAHTFSLGITHYLTQKFNVSGNASYSLGSFDSGSSFNNVGSRDENTMNLGISLGYEFTDWLSAEAGYSYTSVTSDSPSQGRGYHRNQVFIGVTGKY